VKYVCETYKGTEKIDACSTIFENSNVVEKSKCYANDDKIKIDLYAESECPYCIQVLTKSFKTAFNTPDFDKICDLNFYPFGNAKEIKNSDGKLLIATKF
jgi:hypothetical protein